MAGRKPKPTKLKVLEGNPGKQRLPKGEPEPISDIPTPPEHLDDLALSEWHRLADGLHSMGLLYEVDRVAFASYCRAYSAWVRAVLAQDDDRASDAEKQMLKFSVEFGMTPSARARLAIDPGRAKKSKFEGLIGGKKD